MTNKNKNKKITHNNVKKFDLKRFINYVLVFSLIINLILALIILLPKNNNIENLNIAIGKASYTSNGVSVLADDEDLNFRVKTAQLWDNSIGRLSGYLAVFKIDNFPDCTMIVDNDVLIHSINLMQPLYLKGEAQNIGSYLYKFYALGLQSLVGNEGVFKSENNEALVNFSDKFRTSLLKTMKILFIKIKGRDEYNKLYPNGITLASVGTKLKTFEALDIDGKKMNLEDIKGKKTAFVYVDSGCGSCKSKCSTMRDMLEKNGVYVIFISSGESSEVYDFRKQDVRGEPLIFDSDSKVSNLLYLGDPAYLMLVDENLNIKFKAHINEVTIDAEPAINVFTK
jgi:peroxiredoxin